MAVTSSELLSRLNASDVDEAEAARQLGIATIIVDQLVARFEDAVVPAEILDESYLRCAVNLFNRAQAPNGFLMQMGDGGSTPLRVALDPLVDAYPLLSPYGVINLGFA